MDQHSADNELVLSMLGAASSLQKLNERLDRISLHSNSSPRTKSREGRDLPWQLDRESLSCMEDSASESQMLRLSHTSSKFDSAFGSQTDEESGSLHNQFESPRFSDHHATTNRSSSRQHHSAETASGHQSYKKRRKKRHQLHEHSASLDISSPDVTPELLRYSHKVSLKSDTNSLNYSPTSTAAYLHPEIMGRLKRVDSTRSVSSTASNSSIRSTSSRILSLGLSTDDLKEMASKSLSKKVVHAHSPAPKLDTRLKQIHVDVHKQAAESNSDMDTGNSGASTPVLPNKFQLQTSESFQHREADSDVEAIQQHDPIADLEYPLTPEVTVIDPRKDTTEKVKEQSGDRKLVSEEMGGKEQSTAVPKSRKKPARVTINPTPIITQEPPTKGTVFYHESLTPQPSPRHQLPNRYNQNETDSPQKHSNTPKRRGSILQRLRRRHGSFNSAKRPKRYVPVKRSFSDRMTYDIRKGWIDYEEDLEFISNPSKLRRVGRMIARKAGTLHIVQLNRPPSGLYGIYISQTEARPGIFISRFADPNAEKFYTGLLSPGDEIIRVNREDVKNKSVDDVYDMLETLDTVIFSIVPVCSRPDW